MSFEPGDQVICVSAAMPCGCVPQSSPFIPTIGSVRLVGEVGAGYCYKCGALEPAFIPADSPLPSGAGYAQAQFRKLRPNEIEARKAWDAMRNTPPVLDPKRHSRELA